MISLAFREILPDPVLTELDQLVAGIRSYLFVEHNQQGGHTDITADSVTITSNTSFLTLVSNLLLPEGTTILQLQQEVFQGLNGSQYLRAIFNSMDGRGISFFGPGFSNDFDAIFETSQRQANVGVLDPGASLSSQFPVASHEFFNALSVMDRFRFTGQSSYTPGALDSSASLFDQANGPRYSFYRLTPTQNRDIHGIYSGSAFNSGTAYGQVLLLFNDSEFNITFGTGVVSNSNKLLGVPNIQGNLGVMGPQGSAILVYDNENLGWRIFGIYGNTQTGGWTTYSPSWTTASGTAPSVGDGTLSGRYTQIGKTVHYELVLTAGSTTTFGNGGAWRFSLPVTVGGIAQMISHSRCIDISTGAVAFGLSSIATGTTVAASSGVAAAAVTNAAPFAWAAGDFFTLTGTYESA